MLICLQNNNKDEHSGVEWPNWGLGKLVQLGGGVNCAYP